MLVFVCVSVCFYCVRLKAEQIWVTILYKMYLNCELITITMALNNYLIIRSEVLIAFHLNYDNIKT